MTEKSLKSSIQFNCFSENKSSLPLHIQKFEPLHTWMKALYKSVNAFKKSAETIPDAVSILETLINKSYSQSSRVKYFNELALIESHHLKNLEKSAALTLEGVKSSNMSLIATCESLERISKLLKRKNGLSDETRTALINVQENIKMEYPDPDQTQTKVISANLANRYVNLFIFKVKGYENFNHWFF